MRHIAFLCAVVFVFARCASAQVAPANALLFGTPEPAAFALAMPAASAAPSPIPAAEPQGVYGVFRDFNFEAYAGFTYVRFYELPGITGNLYGFNFSVVYFPHTGRLGLDGEFATVFAPQNGINTTLVLGMGGGRFRLTGDRGLVPWVHALAGGAHFTPQTPYGGESAFAFEAGGGIDLDRHNRRLGYRLQADLVATYFFGTYQYNPKVSVGIFYKF
jgi:hypothetical protein